MKKQFHYYAVRYLSSAMGFEDKISSWIAAASQYIDDCTSVDETHSYIKSLIPEEIIKRKLYQEIDGKLVIPIPKTAIDSQAGDSEYLNKENQINSVIPFHYYPPQKVPFPPERYSDPDDYYYVRQMKDWNTSILKDVLIQAAKQYQKAASKEELSAAAIRIGVLAHVIADTFAHRYLSGFESFVNDTQIKQLQENISMQDIRKQYPDETILQTRPKVGDGRLGGSLDDLNVVVVFSQKTSEDPEKIWSGGHVVNTADAFIDAAHMLYRYFLFIRKEEDFNEEHWNGMYYAVLQKMSQMRGKSDADFERLLQESLGTKCSYTYDAFQVTSDLSDQAALLSEYVLVVDDIRNSVRQISS